VCSIAPTIEPSCCALERKAVLDYWLGHSSVGALKPRLPALERSVSMLNAQNFLVMLQFLDLFYFLENA
jgi:hypothetical protein